MSADLPEGFTAAPPGGNGGGGAEEAQKRAQEEDMRQQMIHSILDVDAQARLARIALVKPDKARLLQNKLLMAAQSGSITQKIKEQALIQMLESISGAAESKVTIQRRDDDDSSDDDNDDWAR